MKIEHHPFEIIDWSNVPDEHHTGEKGSATWKVLLVGNIRVRKVEYSPGYIADHWCNKGHIIHCIDGEMITELKDGRRMKLLKGSTYIVGDDSEAHKTSSTNGCMLFIVD